MTRIREEEEDCATYGVMMIIMGSLLFSAPVVKRFLSKKQSSFGGQILMVLGDK